jgi:hypothetical protein
VKFPGSRLKYLNCGSATIELGFWKTRCSPLNQAKLSPLLSMSWSGR